MTLGCLHNPKKMCNSCRLKRWREKDKVRLYYHRLKYRAYKRNKTFELTLEEFRILCAETGYIRLREAGYDATWDRIKEHGEYSFANMQVLVRTDNIKKFKEFLKSGNWSVVVPKEDCPF